ncbi:hypothetical protein UPYG_G00060640 [Umbra pygmaea]|uniref:Cadherin-1 n=1 Tax=Umbra pygmaea TaxID=75934 RepID=A0ABD0XCL7_UMBPY
MKFTVPVRVLHEAKHGHRHHALSTQPQPGAAPSIPVLEFPKSSSGLKRRKRDCVIPPINVQENLRGPYPILLMRGFSPCTGYAVKIAYSITGPGADQPPVGLFTINKNDGSLYVTEPLDREKRDQYTLFAHAVAVSSVKAEEPMEIIVNVIEHPCTFYTKETFKGEVPESLRLGDVFMTVNATDLDEPGSANSDIRYSILRQDPPLPSNNMFFINSVTGAISVRTAGLDREKIPKYTLDIQAADMEGEGLTAQCEAIITVADSNDNAPQFVPALYTMSVPENQVNAEVVIMSATDGDDPDTSAWATIFTIVKGDPDKLFTVSTGPTKLQGTIYTAKPLDFEKNSQYTLLVTVENEIPFVTIMATSTATVIVNVEDVNEAPIFSPVMKSVTKPEDLAVGSDLVLYTATDPDTARKQKITTHRQEEELMYKLRDHAGWFSVNQTTGLIKVRSPMDRESSFVQNNKYTVHVLAIDNDESPATGTGTLSVQLEDVNDPPTLDEREVRVCNRESSDQYLTVIDKDEVGNGAPYSVQLQGLSNSHWTARMNATKTGIILNLKTQLESGEYMVVLRVTDNQGLAQDITIQAIVCDCSGNDVNCFVSCSYNAGAGVGLSGILGILGAVLLLLLLALLLLMFMRRRKGGGEDDQNLKAADNDPTAPPYDSLLVFDYEGGGSEAGSLSSLNSSSSGDDYNYDLFQEWEPRFKKLADMYRGGEN